jgi:Tol biopolymer transport system component
MEVRSHSGAGRYSRAVAPLISAAVLCLAGCGDSPGGPDNGAPIPEHDKRYGIYVMDLATKATDLIYTSGNSLHRVHENPAGTALVFQEDFGSDTFHDSEICRIDTDGSGYRRLTDNTWLDAYPSWSPDGSEILFLSWPDYPLNTMDIFLMNAEGANPERLYDSGFHDGDCYWVDSLIVFTRQSQIWLMRDDGTGARQVTDYARAGEEGNADLPFGDYDPRLDPSGTVICFDRMVDDESPSGNYDFYTITTERTQEQAITHTGWQQFIAEWSHAGDHLLFTMAAKGGGGIYDLYMMNPDGSEVVDIIPSNWPQELLCSHGVFSRDDSKVYFVGEWWE